MPLEQAPSSLLSTCRQTLLFLRHLSCENCRRRRRESCLRPSRSELIADSVPSPQCAALGLHHVPTALSEESNASGKELHRRTSPAPTFSASQSLTSFRPTRRIHHPRRKPPPGRRAPFDNPENQLARPATRVSARPSNLVLPQQHSYSTARLPLLPPPSPPNQFLLLPPPNQPLL